MGVQGNDVTIGNFPNLVQAEEEESYLGFHMVGDIVDSAPEWDFSHWPRGVIGQVGRQNTYPQLPLQASIKTR